MYRDIHIGGVLVASFVGYALAAFLVMLVLRRVFARVRLSRYVANPPLVQAGVYVCVLAVLILLL